MKILRKRISVLLLSMCLCHNLFSQKMDIFPDVDETKIQGLISQMTLTEKIYQLNAYYYGSNIYSNANLRLGIPNLIAGECLNGFMGKGATRFPQAIAMASTWDPELIEKMGNVVAQEARAYGVHQCYSPMLAVVRDIRWGRVEESYGEDPFLVGAIGAAYINGLQGRGRLRFDKNHILACAKHYVGDGEPMAGANGAAMDVSEYNLQNIHLYPFRMAIEKAKVSSIMPAHHLLNGVPCHANHHILKEILRDQYGWNGHVISDNQDLWRVKSLFHYAPDNASTAFKAMNAGVHQELDISTENLDYFHRMYGTQSIEEAIKGGLISEDLLNETVAMNLRVKFALGLFDTELPSKKEYLEMKGCPPVYYTNPFGRYRDIDTTKFASIKNIHDGKINWEAINDKSHDKLALEVAEKAIILLKNENNILPLNINELKKIAVIGPNADAVRVGGYGVGKLKYFVTILEGIKKYAGNKAEVKYAEGTGIDTDAPADYDGQFSLELTRSAEDARPKTDIPETQRITEAVEIAKQSDVVILAIGGSEATCRENEDTDYLGLRGRQLELVQKVYATGKPCVVVFLGGRPLAINWVAEHIPGVIQGWYLGQETGTAIANVLFGKINPGGKLPITVPRNVGQVPLFYNKLDGGRPRRIYRSSPEPLFPFGYGLSYTTFQLENMKLEDDQISPDGNTTLSVNITNTGEVAGEEIVQLYIKAWGTERIRPNKELRGFQRVYLEPGQKKTVTFEIGKEQLEYWNEQWLVEPGKYTLYIATDSSDEKLSLNHTNLLVSNKK
ncbi:MAG: glycoside hydrolase family 3 C-terminal domain-containing protein [Massilibacteroides sp.]|nr:glycoside hydrolase family 3 C-terminal domain-containing protein [Massilibacteroides sp.]